MQRSGSRFRWRQRSLIGRKDFSISRKLYSLESAVANNCEARAHERRQIDDDSASSAQVHHRRFCLRQPRLKEEGGHRLTDPSQWNCLLRCMHGIIEGTQPGGIQMPHMDRVRTAASSQMVVHPTHRSAKQRVDWLLNKDHKQVLKHFSESSGIQNRLC